MGETQLRQYMVFGGHDMRVIQNDGSLNSVIYWVPPSYICWSVNPGVWVYLEIGPLKIIKVKCSHRNGALIQKIWKKEKEEEIDYKELTCMVMKADRSKICRADVPVQVQRVEGAVEPRGTSSPFWRLSGRRILSHFGGNPSFGLVKPSADWVRPTHITEYSLLSSIHCFKC